MYQRDYLLRLIEQMTEALGTVMQLRRERKFEQAGEAVDGLLHRLGLPGRQVLASLAAEEIERLLQPNGEPDADKLFATARLLREDADVRADAGDGEGARYIYAKALRLASSGVRRLSAQASSLPKEAALEAMALRERLRGRRLPLGVSREAAELFERIERYDLAENYWFEAAESADGDESVVREGVAFYERILKLPDSRLTRAALPREEAEEGITEFRRRFSERND